MIEQLYSINLVLIVLTLSWVEKNQIRKIITPFTLSAWPFTVICLLTNFILVYFGFKAVSGRAQLFILANLIVIWIVGFFVTLRYRDVIPEMENVRFNTLFPQIAKFQVFILAISWIIVILNFNRIFEIVNKFGGVWILGDEKFEKMMSQGIISHLVELGKVCFIFLVFTYRYAKIKSFYIITLLALLINTASSMVKYHLFWIVIIAFLFFIVDKPIKEQFRRITIFLFVLFLIMNLFWVSLTLAWGTFSFENKAVWEFFGKHFINYFVSAPIVLDFWMDLGATKPDWTLFIVGKNIWNVLIGNPERIFAVPFVSHGFFEVAPGSSSNVGTSFGVYYLIGGIPLTLAVTLIMAFTGYIVYFQSFIKKSINLVFLNLFIMNLFLLSFFAQYFVWFSMYEMIGMFLILSMLFKIINVILKQISAGLNQP